MYALYPFAFLNPILRENAYFPDSTIHVFHSVGSFLVYPPRRRRFLFSREVWAEAPFLNSGLGR
jgi:hypothetical protein